MQGGAGGEERGEPGRRGGPGQCAKPRRPVRRADAGCDRPAAAARGTATRLWRLRGLETGKDGSGKRRDGAGPASGTSEAPGTSQQLTSRGSPSGLLGPANPEEAGQTPGRGGCREPVAWATGWASESSGDSSAESRSGRATSVGRPTARK